MKNQILLDNLMLMNETERLTTIIENADSILNEEFITFMRGQIKFAESIENGAKYFEKIYLGEDASLLNFLKKEMGQHTVYVSIVWNSMQNIVHYLDEKLLLKTAIKSSIKDHILAISTETNPCYMCSELSNSHGICSGCLQIGNPPASVLPKDGKKDKDQKVHVKMWTKKDYVQLKSYFT